MTSYSLESVKKKIVGLTNTKGEGKKMAWAKFDIGTYDVRFIPLADKDGNALSQPFFEVAYYDNKDLEERRFVTPSSFGHPDCLKEAAMELAKDRSKEAWLVRKKLTPKERYYAAVIVRGQEEKGLQVWEISAKLCKDIYAILVHEDYVEEDMFSPETGFDFVVNVSATDKTFNGYPVKEIKLQPRRKSSKMFAKKEQTEAVMKSRPDFASYFGSQVKTEEEMSEILKNFLILQSGASGAEESVGTSTSEGTVRGKTEDVSKAAADVDAAFADMD